MDTELNQLVGLMDIGKGPVEVKHAVDVIMHNGKEVGLVGRHTGAPIILYPYVQESLRDDIKKHVVELRKQDGQYGPPSGTVNQAPTVPQEIIDELTEEDDE